MRFIFISPTHSFCMIFNTALQREQVAVQWTAEKQTERTRWCVQGIYLLAYALHHCCYRSLCIPRSSSCMSCFGLWNLRLQNSLFGVRSLGPPIAVHHNSLQRGLLCWRWVGREVRRSRPRLTTKLRPFLFVHVTFLQRSADGPRKVEPEVAHAARARTWKKGRGSNRPQNTCGDLDHSCRARARARARDREDNGQG